MLLIERHHALVAVRHLVQTVVAIGIAASGGGGAAATAVWLHGASGCRRCSGRGRARGRIASHGAPPARTTRLRKGRSGTKRDREDNCRFHNFHGKIPLGSKPSSWPWFLRPTSRSQMDPCSELLRRHWNAVAGLRVGKLGLERQVPFVKPIKLLA
jgi:hypothetical protein